MQGLRGAIAASAAFVALLAALPAGADGPTDWAGPYVGPVAGFGWGTSTYHFNSDGWFNTAPGQEFTAPVRGYPFGAVLGYNWQSNSFVYGFEATFLTAVRGISHADFDSPYFPGDHDFNLKGHWIAAATARIGWSLGPVLFSVNAGPALAHLINDLDDDTGPLRVSDRGPVPGIAAGAAVDFAVSDRVALGVGYEFYAFAPLSVFITGPGDTDHTVQFTAHTVTARLTLMTGDDGAANAWSSAPRLEWSGPYVGITASTFHELGVQGGYNYVLGGRFFVGVSAQAAAVICVGVATCGPIQFEGDVSARAGAVVADDILVYGKAGIGYMTGSHFGLIDGALYSIGGGVEVALTGRTSAFMEVLGVGEFGASLFDLSFRGGFNLHFGGMGR